MRPPDRNQADYGTSRKASPRDSAVLVDAGSTSELRGKEGVAALTAATLLEGTTKIGRS